MGLRPMFLLDAGETKELIPLKLLYFVHYFAFSVQTYLPVRLSGFRTSSTDRTLTSKLVPA
jgi:hypothetical protein